MKVAAVTCVKNEGPFILEWIAYGRVIGIENFLFYSNDCDDGTDHLLDGLDAAGIVTHLPNPARGRKYQIEALRHARRQPIFTEADWVWNADVDEFLNIHTGRGTVQELIEACGHPAAISVSHQNFANNGVERFVDQPVISQFEHSHNPDIWCDRFDIEVKTLLRTDFPLGFLGVHRPFFDKTIGKGNVPKWTDGSGRQVPNRFSLNEGEKRQFGYRGQGARASATLNHYTLRSLDSYLVKSDRGDANRDFRFFDDSYWRKRNDASFHDTSIKSKLSAVEFEISELKKMGDVGALHEKCVAAHRAKIERLNEDPNFADLRAKLRAAPPTPPAELAAMAELTNMAAA